MENKCSAITSRFYWVTGMTGSSPLDSNPQVSTFHPPWDKPPPSQQSSHQLTKNVTIAAVTFHFKPFPQSLLGTSTSLPMDQFEKESRTVVLAESSSVKKTSSMSNMPQWAPIVDPSRQSGPPSKKPSNWYAIFHHGPQQPSSITANHWLKRLATLTQQTRLSSCGSTRYVKIYSYCVGSWSLWSVR